MAAMKPLFAIAFVGILAALAIAGVFMVRGGRKDGADAHRRMARALAVRVGLSVALFLFVLLSYKLGWIRPTGIPLN